MSLMACIQQFHRNIFKIASNSFMSIKIHRNTTHSICGAIVNNLFYKLAYVALPPIIHEERQPLSFYLAIKVNVEIL